MPSPNARDDYLAAAKLMVASPLVDRPGSGTVAEREAVLRQNAAALARLRVGLTRVYREPPGSVGPYAGHRQLARLLVAEASVYADRGEWGRAASSHLDLQEMASDVPRGGCIIALLVGNACSAVGRRHFWPVVPHLSASEARTAGRRLRAILDGEVAYPDVIREEKRFMLASLGQLFGTPGWRTQPLRQGVTRESAKETLVNLRTSRSETIREVSRYMDQAARTAGQRYGSRPARPPLPRGQFSREGIDLVLDAWYSHTHHQALNRMLLVALALQAYRREQGAYPQRLEALVPGCLARLPDDPFAPAGSFRYRRAGGSYVLYSLGPDGKDNGGTPVATRVATATGDIVAGRPPW